MANNVFQVKRTSTAGRTPNTTGSYATNTQYIGAGEFALNMADQILYTSNGSVVITVGANLVNQRITNSLTLDNDKNLNFKTVNTSATVGMRQQSDDNFVFYSTNTSYGQRPIWAIFANSDTSSLSILTPITFNGNVNQIVANGTLGTNGQVLASNGSGIYWTTSSGAGTVTSVGSGNGLTGGPITGAGSLSLLANNGIIANSTGTFVNGNTGLVVNSTGVFVNAAYIGTISSNNASFLGGVAAASYVNTSGSYTLSGNLNFTSVSASANVTVGANVIANLTTVAVGNSTVYSNVAAGTINITGLATTGNLNTTTANATTLNATNATITNGITIGPQLTVRGTATAAGEGGQITLGYGNNLAGSITGQANNTFNIDVTGGNTGSTPLLRLFAVNNDGTVNSIASFANTGRITFGSTAENTETTVKIIGTANVTQLLNASGDLNTVTANVTTLNVTGNVGIGVAAGTNKVYIKSTSNTQYALISQSPIVGLTTGDYVNMAYFTNSRSTNNDGLRIVNVRDSTGSSTGDWPTESYRIRRSVDQNDASTGVQEEIIFGTNLLAFNINGTERMRVSDTGIAVTGTANISGVTTHAANVAMANNYLTEPTLKSYKEFVQAGGTVTTSYTANLALSNIFTLTGTNGSNCVFTFGSPPASGNSQMFTIVFKQPASGSANVTWPAAVKWSYGDTPVISSTVNSRDVFTFLTFDGGTTYLGAYSMANVAS